MEPILTAILLGIYVGVIPVYLGFFPAPLLRRIGERWMTALVSLSLGVLLFLLVDVAAEGLEMAGKLNAAMQVPAPGDATVPALDAFFFEAVGAPGALWLGPAIVLLGLGGGLALLVWAGRRPHKADAGPAAASWRLAALIAAGIGLHNLGEGLAVGAAMGGGNLALASLLVFGFALHNTTEGIAIIAPASRERLSIARILWLGALAGVPTVFGALLGLLFFSNVLGVLFFAIAAGAVLYVVMEIVAHYGKAFSNSYRNYGALTAGFAIMLFTAQFVLL